MRVRTEWKVEYVNNCAQQQICEGQNINAYKEKELEDEVMVCICVWELEFEIVKSEGSLDWNVFIDILYVYKTFVLRNQALCLFILYGLESNNEEHLRYRLTLK